MRATQRCPVECHVTHPTLPSRPTVQLQLTKSLMYHKTPIAQGVGERVGASETRQMSSAMHCLVYGMFANDFLIN